MRETKNDAAGKDCRQEKVRYKVVIIIRPVISK
jgi:hypothetical protein